MTLESDGRAARDKQGSSRHALNMVTLYFKDIEVERTFLHENLRHSLPLIRLSLFFAALLYGSFGILDHYVAGPDKETLWLIRFGVVCPMLIACAAATFLPAFERIAQPLLSLSMAVAGYGVVAMTLFGHPPVNSLYYAGLIMVVIYGSTLVRLRFLYSAIISVLLVVSYQVVALGLNPIPHATLISNNFFLVMATAVGVFASYIQELYIRRNWVATQLLTEEKERSEGLLAESQAANHAKSEFLAIVSHELRTPLNAIIGFSEFLKLEMFGPLGSGRYKAYAEDIYASGNHLLEIINDILDLSRAEANKLEVSEDEVMIGDVIDSCLRMLRTKAAEEGVRLSCDSTSIRPKLRADQRLVTQVLINLLSNAIKFTPRGGEVTVLLTMAEDGSCSLTVRDTGIGIAEEHIPRILEPFVQLESSQNRQHEGLGLGLPLVKRIMDLHEGGIEIVSAPNAGTSVTIRFPGTRVIRRQMTHAEPTTWTLRTGNG